MSTITKTEIQPYCEPVETLGDSSEAAELAALMIEESGQDINGTAADESPSSPVQREIEAVNASKLFASAEQRDRQIEALTANQGLIELGEDSRRTQVAYGCGACAIATTCQVKTRLDEFITIGDTAQETVTEITRARETGERIKPLIDGFRAWSRNEAILKRPENSGRNRPEIIKLVKENNTVHANYIKHFIEIENPEERDREIQTIYAALDPDMRKKFAEDGFIEGVATELYTFEELSKLKDSVDCEVELSTSDEDVHDGYDIKITLNKSKQVFYIDAKSSMPHDANQKRKNPNYFGEKNSTTRAGDPVFVVCPNPKNNPLGSYLKTQVLEPGSRRIISFQPKEYQAEQRPFVDVIRESLAEVAQERRALKEYLLTRSSDR